MHIYFYTKEVGILRQFAPRGIINRHTQMMEESIFVKDKLTEVSKKTKQNNMVMVHRELGLVK